MSARRSATGKRQYSQPENTYEQSLWSLRNCPGARLILVNPVGDDDFIPAWTSYNTCKPPGSGHCIDHVRTGGMMGWQPVSFGCIGVDVDHGDATKLALAYPPLVYLKTRHGAHLVYRAGNVNVIDNTNFEWAGLTGQIKTTGLCRFHGAGAERLASALHEADGDGPKFPVEILKPGQVTLGNKPAHHNKTPNLTVLPRNDEICVGNRNVSLFELGRHATYRFQFRDFADLERQCIDHAFAIAESFPCESELEGKIRATGRSWARFRWRWETGKQTPPSGTRPRSKHHTKALDSSQAQAKANRGEHTGSTGIPPLGPDSQGGMSEPRFTPARPLGSDSWAQKRRSRGGQVRAARARDKNVRRDCLIWRLNE